jgi:hypothetical protein
MISKMHKYTAPFWFPYLMIVHRATPTPRYKADRLITKRQMPLPLLVVRSRPPRWSRYAHKRQAVPSW